MNDETEQSQEPPKRPPSVIETVARDEEAARPPKNNASSIEDLESDIRTDVAWTKMLAFKGVKIVEFYADWTKPSFPLVHHGGTLVNKYSTDICQIKYFTVCSDFVTEGSRYKGKCRPMTHIFVDSDLIEIVAGVDILTIEEIVSNYSTNYSGTDAISERTETPQTPAEFSDEDERESGVYQGKTVYNVSRSESLENLMSLNGERLNAHQWLAERPIQVKLRIIVIKPNIVKMKQSLQRIEQMLDAGSINVFKRLETTIKPEIIKMMASSDENIKADEKLERNKLMTSGSSVILAVYSGTTGKGTDEALAAVVGDEDPTVAKRTNPKSIRAQFGKSIVNNAIEITLTDQDTNQILDAFFPKPNRMYVSDGIQYQDFVQGEKTLAIIRPTAVKKFESQIMKDIQDAGFEIIFSKYQTINSEDAMKIYSVHKNRYYFDDLVMEMTSSKSRILLLQKEFAINEFRALIGPASKEKLAKRPESLRAKYNTWETGVNCIHASSNPGSARFEIGLFFPVQMTMAMIKPEHTPELVKEIVRIVRRNKFSIMRQKQILISRKLAFKMYKHLEGEAYYPRLITYITSGPSIGMLLKREDAMGAWREIIGPFNPRQARRENPGSIRAKHGEDEVRNVVHGSSDINKAMMLIEELFDGAGSSSSIRDFHRASTFHPEEIVRKGEDAIFDVPEDPRSEKADYLIQIVTETGPASPAIPNVYMTLVGAEGKRTGLLSLMVPLTLRSPFVSGAVDSYIHQDIDVGSISSIELIGMAENGFPDGWHVRSIEVINRTRGENFFVGIDTIVQPTNGTAIAYTDIIESKSKERFKNDFDVLIETGDGKYTGTQAAVNLFLIDEKGQESHTNLLTSISGTYLPLENGRKSIFMARKEPDFGEVTKIRINQKTQRSAPAWYINQIIVVGQTADNQQAKVYKFPVYRWLDEYFGDRKTELELEMNTLPGYDEKLIKEIHESETRYSILTRTGYMPDASFDGAVKVTLYGKDPDKVFSSYLEICEGTFYPFEYGSVDEFVYYADDIGELSKIDIHAEESETTGAWFLDFIRVQIGPDRIHNYEIGHFLNVEEGGCVISIDVARGYERPKSDENWRNDLRRAQSMILRASTPDVHNVPVNSIYEVTIHTVDCDGYVPESIITTIEIIGERGRWDHVLLPSSEYSKLFTRGGIVSFVIPIRNVYCPVKAWIRLIRNQVEYSNRSSMTWTIGSVTIGKPDIPIKIRLQSSGIVCLAKNKDVALDRLVPYIPFDRYQTKRVS